ncbi:putative hydrolase [Gracilariopsis chorda]|uniref:Putative hydrolase n=1 Tax=Gracilariopsis chorda TaxID=448386 RepID=A0A2V3IKH3_9FLOR|nr:putative hydrolase [Gracilariopsis chorda]|eukprot:PXF42543.1 putative hydrolase [Gracilariopsis chorda]
MSIPKPALAQPNEFVILGSGVSTSVPKINCIIRPSDEGVCQVCRHAFENPFSKERRNNVCALVRHSGKTVLIDCGKTMRDSTMRQFPKLGVRDVDAIVLTHGHADAVLGLDDARDLQRGPTRHMENGRAVWRGPAPTPVYLNEETMEVCRRVFPYLMPRSEATKNGQHIKKDIPRRVASLDWKVFGESHYLKPFYPIKGAGIQLTPIKMWHGGDYVCMGYLIRMEESPGTKEKVIAYLSDLHALPDESMRFLKRQPRIDLLVVDLLANGQNASHLNREEAVNLVRELRPLEAVAVGMTCSVGFHEVVNGELAILEKTEGIRFRLAYDGERFPC